MSKTPIAEAKDYHGNTLKVGDYAKGLETGWIGKILEMTEETVWIDETRSFIQRICKMQGVEMFAVWIDGATLDEALCSDDTQWFGAEDLIRIKVPR